MAPQLIKTTTLTRPYELWETITTTAGTSSSAPNVENMKSFAGRTGPSLEPNPSSSWRATRRVEAAVSRAHNGAEALFASSTPLARRQHLSAVKGHPISNTRAAPTASNLARKVYGIVPNSPSRRAEASLDGFQTQVQTAGSAFTGPPLRSEKPQVNAGQGVHDRLPDIPPWFVGVIIGGLIAGFIFAILFYLVNFPPQLRWLRRIRGRQYGYQQVRDRDIELDELHSTNPTSMDTNTGFSTSADTPTSTIHQRRAAKHRSFDTAAFHAGLGITVDGATAHELRKRRSFDDRLVIRESSPSQLSESPAATPSPQHPMTAPLPSVTTPELRLSSLSKATEHLPSLSRVTRRRSRQPDLEDGLLKPTFNREGSSDSDSPSPPLSGSSSRSSSRVRLLGKIGDGVEFAADFLARKMHDQVRDDPEEGLLLPIRATERERLAGLC